MFYFKTIVDNEHNTITKVSNEHLLLAMNKDFYEFSIVCDEAPVTHYLTMYFKYSNLANKVVTKSRGRAKPNGNKNTLPSRIIKNHVSLKVRMSGRGKYNSRIREKSLTKGRPREIVSISHASKIGSVFGKIIGFVENSYKSVSQEIGSTLTTLTSMRANYKNKSLITSTHTTSKINMGDSKYKFSTIMDTTLIHTTQNSWGKISRVMTSWKEVRDKFANWEDVKNFIKKEGEK